MNDANGETPEGFATTLAQYKKAIEDEFRVSNPKEFDQDKKEEYADKAKAKMVELVPTAVATLETLLVHGEKESIKFAAAKYVLDNALGDKGFAPPVDPMQQLLADMAKAERA